MWAKTYSIRVPSATYNSVYQLDPYKEKLIATGILDGKVVSLIASEVFIASQIEKRLVYGYF
jgi:hypothetical protein